MTQPSGSVGGVVITCTLADVETVRGLLETWEKSGRTLPETFALDRQGEVVTLHATLRNYAVSQKVSAFLLAQFKGDQVRLLDSATASMAEALACRSGEVPSYLFPRGLEA